MTSGILKLGGGGWLVGVDIANDGQTIGVTDTYGAWIKRVGSSTFEPLITQSSMPAANFGYYPTTGTSQILQEIGPPAAVSSAPQNSAYIYMMYYGYMFRSTDHGVTFTRLSNFYGGLRVPSVLGSNYRQSGRKIAVDPQNVNHVYVGTDLNGLHETTDGGTTWAEITGVPESTGDVTKQVSNASWAATSGGQITITTSAAHGLSATHTFSLTNISPSGYNGQYTAIAGTTGSAIVAAKTSNPGAYVSGGQVSSWVYGQRGPTFDASAPNYNIAFDPASGLTGSNTSKCYAFAYVNTAGTLSGNMYVTTNGGSSWAAAAGAGNPTSCSHLVVAPTGGVVWLVDCTSQNDVGIPYKWNAGTWTNYSGAIGSDFHCVAVDPSDATRVVFGRVNGDLRITTNSGTSWTGNCTFTRVATDIPWLADTNEFFMSNGDMVFDPSRSNTLIFGNGIGVWETNPPSTTVDFVWTSKTANIEQMDAMDVIAPNGVPVVGIQDRGTFQLTPGAYPSTHANNTYKNGISLTVTNSLDWASSDSNFMVTRTSVWGAFRSYSGSSIDGGGTFKPFNSYYQTVAATAMVNDGTGKAKITMPSVSGLTTWSNGVGSIIHLIGYNGRQNNVYGFYPVTVSGSDIILQNSNIGDFDTSAGNFIICVDTGPLSANNGLFVVSGAVSGTGSRILLTVHANASGSMDNRTLVRVAGVGGVTAATGDWVTTNVSGNTFELYGSTFAGAYTSGGTAKMNVAAGGSIAASTPLNMVMIPANINHPLWTADGGLTWTEIDYPSVAALAETGWPTAYYLVTKCVCADRVTANTFYAYNYLKGFLRITGTGTPTVMSGSQLNSGVGGYVANTETANLFPGSPSNITVRSVPRNAAHLFITMGKQGSTGATHPATAALLYRSTDGGANWFAIAGMTEPICVDAGATAPGSDYPTVHVWGWYNQVYGLWRTTGTAAQWSAGGGTGSALVWEKIEDYPTGSMDIVNCFAADQATWNKWYTGLGGSSFVFSDTATVVRLRGHSRVHHM